MQSYKNWGKHLEASIIESGHIIGIELLILKIFIITTIYNTGIIGSD